MCCSSAFFVLFLFVCLLFNAPSMAECHSQTLKAATMTKPSSLTVMTPTAPSSLFRSSARTHRGDSRQPSRDYIFCSPPPPPPPPPTHTHCVLFIFVICYSAVSGHLDRLCCRRCRCPSAVVKRFQPKRDGAV